MSPTPTKAKIKKKIQVTNPQGFMQVYQMWFMREGINMSMEDLEKIHKKMISYCEKVVNKDGERIQSAFVRYVDDVIANDMRKLYLSSWINFGKYRREPSILKKILDTEEGRKWFRWLMDNTYNFEFDFAVIEYLKLKEEDARYVLPTVGG